MWAFNTVSIVFTVDFALLLNMTHAGIRTKLEEKFDLAVSLCARGEHFCIEVLKLQKHELCLHFENLFD